jgi:hypothetical protein
LWWGGIHVKGNWNMIMEGFKRPKKKKKLKYKFFFVLLQLLFFLFHYMLLSVYKNRKLGAICETSVVSDHA